MEQNYFQCPYCRSKTKHVKAKGTEWFAQNKDGIVDEGLHLLVRMNQLTGFNKILEGTLGFQCWKCTECLRVVRYNEAGGLFNGG
jgi:hypothetical protein